MKFSRRDRREWRIIFWVSIVSAIVSAGFAVRVAPAGEWWLRSMVHGVVTCLVVATPILTLQFRGERLALMRRLQRTPLAVYFIARVLIYFAVIVVGLLFARLILSGDVVHYVRADPIFRQAIVFSIGMSIVGNLFAEFTRLLGLSTLKHLLTGRYAQPRREQKTFLLIDMKDSTGLAERLGPVRFHELLNDFFRDIADAALECEAEIHKYVGDEAILTWPGDAGLDDGASLACPFIARGFIAAHKARYLERFGAVPEFRAVVETGVAGPGQDRLVADILVNLGLALERFTAVRSSPAKSATSAARSPMSATP
jgi:adenylate cyclase